MGDNSNLSIDKMLEMAMGLSMASVFTNAMNSAYDNTKRMLENNEVQAPPKYIHAIIGGQQKGPFTLGEVLTMIQAGDITLETFMWKPGMPEWKLAKDISDISPNFTTTPPPVPQK